MESDQHLTYNTFGSVTAPHCSMSFKYGPVWTLLAFMHLKEIATDELDSSYVSQKPIVLPVPQTIR